jgi:hypothetical protein
LSCGLGTSAVALPGGAKIYADGNGLVQQVASWRYHQNCGWRDGRWVVDLGGARFVACRPNRPSREYSWHREGNREGWYDSRRRSWHYNNW